MNLTMIVGILSLSIGIVVFAVSQIILRRWIKKYNKEWAGGNDNNEVS